jgi:integrase
MLLFSDGFHRVYVSHCFLKGNVWWYRRKVPSDIRARIGGPSLKRLSLKTKDKFEAARLAARQAAIDDATWAQMRDPSQASTDLARSDLTKAALGTLQRLTVTPGATGREAEWTREQLSVYFDDKHLDTRLRDQNPHTGEVPSVQEYLTPFDKELIRVANGEEAPKCLSDALTHYLKEHPKGAQKKFSEDAKRAIDAVLKTVGDLPISAYKRANAEAVRDAILETGVKTTTVKRRIRSISAVFADGIKAFDLNLPGHPFQKLPIKNEGHDSEKREPFTDDELTKIAESIRSLDDDIRYVAGIQFHTGARIGEVVGLKVQDIVLDGSAPHVIFRPYPERSLKTKASERIVPLVGLSLWSARQAVKKAGNGEWLFARYAATGREAKATVAAAAVKKWLNKALCIDKGTHSFRHTLKDKMLAADLPDAVQDAIGGWGKWTPKRGYGNGFTVEKLQEWAKKIKYPAE